MRRLDLAFVLGAPRSGSTWLMRSLGAHPEVHATEHRLFGPHHDEVLDDGTDRPRLRITLDRYADAHSKHVNLCGTGLDAAGARERLIRELAGALHRFDRDTSGKPVIVDKITPYPGTAAHVAERLARVFPSAPVVGLIRDGRDVVTSGAHHWLNKQLAGTVRQAPGTPGRFFDDDTVESWASLWAECTDAASRANTSVRFESMLADQHAELARIFEAIGVRADHDVLDLCVSAGSFERAAGRPRGTHVATAHTRKGISGDWRRVFTRRDGEIFDEHAGAWLESMGYADRSWWRALPETLRQPA